MIGTTGDTVMVYCDDGFIGGGVFTCEQHGRFSGTACSARACTTGLNVAHSNYATTEMSGATSDTVFVQCDTGFSGGGAFECLADGSFSGTACTGDPCTPYSVPNSNFAASGSMIGTTGDTVMVYCDDGFIGGGVFTCEQHGRFSGTACSVPGCTDSDANNFDSAATADDGSCEYPVYGCVYSDANNFDSAATVDDGSCEYSSAVCYFSSGHTSCDTVMEWGDSCSDLLYWGYDCSACDWCQDEDD